MEAVAAHTVLGVVLVGDGIHERFGRHGLVESGVEHTGGTGEYSRGDITPLHISAVSEAMNQMTASSATAMSKMFEKKIDISPPSVQQIVVEEYEFPDDIREDLFVKINFKLRIGKLIDSTIMQLYPFDLAHSIYKLFQRRN